MAVIKKDNSFMEFPLQISRQYGAPIDKFSVFYDKSSADTYASSNPLAYVGQIIVVVDEIGNNAIPYVISNAAGDLVEIGGSGGTSLVVSTFADLTGAGISNDLEVGQTAFVTDEGKSYILTEVGETPPSTYVWVEMTNSDVVWQGTEDPVTFYALTQQAYDSIESPTQTTLYFTTDTGRIYRGTTDVTGHVIVGTSIPEVAQAVQGKLYINSDTFEAKVTVDGNNWVNLSPGYITTGSEWSQVTNDAKLGTIAVIKATIQDALATIDLSTKIDKVAGATDNNLPVLTAEGGLSDSGKKIGGATLAGTTDENTLATEVAVQTAIEAGTANKVDKVTGTVGNAMQFGADGTIVDSGMTFGGATLGASPNTTTLATEAAVEDAISWKELASK